MKENQTLETEPEEEGTTEETATEESAVTDFGEILASWEFPEFEKHERSRRWYLVFSLMIIALLAYAYYQANPLFAIIVILATLIFAIGEMRGADYHSFAIAEDGLIVGTQFYPFDDVKNFYIIYRPPKVKMLYIEPKSFLRPRIGIPLLDADPNVVREMMLEFLPEDLDKEDEPVSDFLARILKL